MNSHRVYFVLHPMCADGRVNTTERCRSIGRGFDADQAPIGAKPEGAGDFALNILAKSLGRTKGYALRFSLDLTTNLLAKMTLSEFKML